MHFLLSRLCPMPPSSTFAVLFATFSIILHFVLSMPKHSMSSRILITVIIHSHTYGGRNRERDIHINNKHWAVIQSGNLFKYFGRNTTEREWEKDTKAQTNMECSPFDWISCPARTFQAQHSHEHAFHTHRHHRAHTHSHCIFGVLVRASCFKCFVVVGPFFAIIINTSLLFGLSS